MSILTLPARVTASRHASLVTTPPATTPLAAAIACALLATLPLHAIGAEHARVSGTGRDEDRETTRTIDAIEVEASRITAPAADDLPAARRRLRERAGATAVVDAERYRDGRASTLTDALGMAPGVFVQSRFGAEEARLSIRGSGLQRTFHGRGVQLLQDGSPLNLADGGFDFQAVEPLSARYIEVYRGANALEYGAATLGGAINFVAPTGHDAPRVRARVEAGAFDYRRAQLAFSGAGTRGDGHLSLTGFRQDGDRDHAEQENHRLFGNAGWRFGDTLGARVYLTHVDTRSALPGSLTFAEYDRDPHQAAPANLALDQRRDFRLDRVAATMQWTPGSGRELRVSLWRSEKSLDHPIFQVLRQDSLDHGLDLRWRAEGTLGGHRNVLVAGVDAADGRIDDNRFVNVGGEAGARTNRFRQHARNLAAYVENQTWLSERLVLALGAQGLQSRRRSHDLFITGGRDESFSRDTHGVSPKLGLRFDQDAHTQWFANLSRSLEPPSFGELSGGPGVTPVDAQRATSAEIGVRVERERLSLDAALYRARVDDELLAMNDGAGNPLGTTNARRTLHQGLEFGFGWTFAETFNLSGNYLWNDFRFDNDPVYGNRDLAGVPEHQLRLQLRWSPDPRFHAAPSLEWVPSDTWIDHANTLDAPGYTLIGLRIGGDMGERWSWFVDGRNLTDRRWIAGTGVVADARGRDGRYLLPGDGRAVYAGFEWKLP